MALPTPPGISTYHTHSYPKISPTRPELSAKDKTIFITGGGAGFGFAVAQHFAQAGCVRIAIFGRRENVLQNARTSLEKEHPGLTVLALQGDVKDKKVVKAAFTQTHQTFGNVNVLVNNAGYLSSFATISSTPEDDDWFTGFTTNVLGSYNVLGQFSAVATSNAVVLNVSTAAVSLVVQGQSGYIASKIASVRLFEHFQVESPEMRVVSVAPGVLETEMNDKVKTHFEKSGWPAPPVDDITLPASWMVWAASSEAEFLNGKFVWAHWDVDELKELVEKDDKHLFVTAVNGMPNLHERN